jgi:predicted phosphodiesterase
VRIAILSDIHANKEAFTACLSDAENRGIGRHVFLGDYVGYGADPVFVLETVMAYVARGAISLLGNHEAAVIAPESGMSDAASIAMAWTRRQLGPAHMAFINRLPLSREEGDRLYVHANTYAPGMWDYVTGLHAASKCLMATGAQTIFCGHTHVPMLFHMSMTGKIASFEPLDRIDIPLTARRRWLAVIGSVGQPRDHNPAAC